MIFIPSWLTNVVFLLTFGISLYGHVRSQMAQRPLSIHFFLAGFSIVMVLIVAFMNRTETWLSPVYLGVAIVCLGVAYRQYRRLPPTPRFD